MRSLAFCCLLFPLLLCAATKELDWKAGKVSADFLISANGYIPGPASRNRAVDPHIVQIQGDNSLYTANEKHAWSGWCLLIQGDPIKYAIDGHRLFVTDAAGQKCPFEILSQEKSPAH